MEYSEKEVSYPFDSELQALFTEQALVGISADDLEKEFAGKSGVMMEFAQGEEDTATYLKQIKEAMGKRAKVKTAKNLAFVAEQNEELNALRMEDLDTAIEAISSAATPGASLLWCIAEREEAPIKITLVAM